LQYNYQNCALAQFSLPTSTALFGGQMQDERQVMPLAIVDLVMPEAIGETAQANSGLQLLKTLMEQYPSLNIVVQSAHVRTLVWLKPSIDNHMGGFTVVDK